MNPAKNITFDTEAREALLEGASIIEKAVGATLGPRGANVAIKRPYGTPLVIHDGVRVARQVKLENPEQDTGVELMRQAAQETNNIAGDGTTTAIVLAYSILSEGNKLVSAGHNSRILRKGVVKATDALVDELDKMAKPVKTLDEKKQVATVSAHDEAIGQAIVTAIDKVGEHGVVTVDQTGSDLSIDYKEGMQFDQGYLVPAWITDQQRMETVLENPLINVTDYNVNDVRLIEDVLANAIKQTKSVNVIVIAKDFSQNVVIWMAENKRQNNFNIVPIKAPGLPDEKSGYLEDIAYMTGAKFMSQERGDKLKNMQVDQLGVARKATIGQDSTILVDGQGASEDIQLRLDYLDEQLARPDLDAYRKERIQTRRAKLSSGVAVINVGGQTESEIDERREQVIDAIGATRAAIEQGVVPGGETALLRARKVLFDLKRDMNEEEAYGVDLVYRAVEQPFRRLLANAGVEAAELMKNVETTGKGYNVLTQKTVDLVKDGVIDPVKVTKNALINAAATATSILTTSVVITDKPESK